MKAISGPRQRHARLVPDQCNLPRHVPGGYHLTVFRSPERVAGDMIEVVPSSWDGHGAQLRLRPPRALTRRPVVMLFGALSGAMWVVAMLGWWGGNAFAPVFALLHSGIVAAAGNVPVPDKKHPYVYRITAYVQGMKGGTRVWLRSIFVPRPQNQNI